MLIKCSIKIILMKNKEELLFIRKILLNGLFKSIIRMDKLTFILEYLIMVDLLLIGILLDKLIIRIFML